jgi:hypothetical protein
MNLSGEWDLDGDTPSQNFVRPKGKTKTGGEKPGAATAEPKQAVNEDKHE